MDHHGRGRPLKSGGDRNRRGRGKGKRRWFDSEQEEFEEKHTAHERSLERRDRRWMGNVRGRAYDAKGTQHFGRRRETNRLNCKMLEDLAKLDPYDAMHKLASCKKRLVELLRENDIQFALMIQLTKVLANICKCSNSSETFLDIIGTLQREGFMDHLATYIQDWPYMALQNHSYIRIVPQLLLPVVIIVSPLLLDSSFHDANIIFSYLDRAVCECQEQGIFFSSESLCELDTLFDNHIDRQERKSDRRRDTFQRDLKRNYADCLLAVKDFREYSTFPMINELKENYRPSLRVNIVNGSYDHVDHYLDVQFRLLREDLIKPLRDGISEYRSTLQALQGTKQVKLQDIYVYHDVQVLESKPGSEGISYLTRFNTNHLKKVQWEKSKRLIYGSLLCLSSDHFKTVIFAVVSSRQARDLKKGLIELKFHEINEVLSTLFSKTFTMVESPAYFEAYRHVLKRLQDTNENNFPLERYIVKAVPKVSYPLYLRQNPCAEYDLKAVSRCQKSLRAYVTITWPSLDNFDLDPSQFEAFKAALTEELCLIQGPPGTGKTFIGLKIVETLLDNSDIWSPDDNPPPILLICYTNHALDQFLEGVLTFLPNEGIIRIGGRSSSEKLKKFNLNEIRRRRSRPKRRRTYVKTIRGEMLRLANRIQETQKASRVTRSKILHEEELMNVMTPGQYGSLMTRFHNECTRQPPKTGEFLTSWLQAVVDEEGTSHKDIAPPIDIRTNNKFAVCKEKGKQYVLKGRKLKQYITKNLTLTTGDISDKVIGMNNVWSLSLTDRWRLYKYWLGNHQQRLQKHFRIASTALLKERILKPFISREHWQSLSSGGESRFVEDGQVLTSYLGVTNGNLFQLIRLIGKSNNFSEMDELRAKIESLKIQEEASVVVKVQHSLHVYIAKALAGIDAMSKTEVQSIRDVYKLSNHNRWRLYKHWSSMYRSDLHERLTASRCNILKEDSLKHQMTSGQYLNLTDPSKDDRIRQVDHGQLLILWLNAYSGVPFTDVQEVLGNSSQESETIDVKGAAELLAEARYIDDEDDDIFQKKLEDLMAYSTDEEEDGEVEVAGATSITQDGEWNIAGKKIKSIRAYVIENLRKNDLLTEEMALRVFNVWELRLCDRWNLYRYWVHLYNTQLHHSLLPLHEEYDRQVKLLKEVREQEDVEIVRKAKIIALTTTGAAKYYNLVERVYPKIVIVEEAAEVLEAHIVTSLTKKCEQLILIGDHQQLRPNPTVYELSTRYGLDISLFERLIKNKFPRHRLNLQHRMRPEISKLLTIHHDFYPGLKDHKSVFLYDDIRGVVKNIFFLDHIFQESRHNDNHSRSNRFEAEFLTSLCRYLLQQDYKPEQITVLTAYTGQVWNFQSLMPKSVFKDVLVCPVDSYQGEENDIILLSLVRSNECGSIGFLKTANRVCVALSRAKKGLYCVGNFSLLSSENDLWRVISSTLLETGSLGKSMKLVCANHPDVVTEVSVAQDFTAVPEGGCSRLCQTLLDCGHVCPLSCHPRDKKHRNFKCRKRCRRPICDLGHMCSKLCFEECESQCNQMVLGQLACGHSKLFVCFKKHSTEIQCQERCQLMLNCGHRCKKKCGEACTTSCHAMVKKILQCGHRVLTECENKEVVCKEKCHELLRCGHHCSGSCGECRRGRLHVECVQPCNRTLICGHKCSSMCSTYCPPCEEKCGNRCVHRKCSKKCGQICTPCHRICGMTCIHRVCLQPCCEPCRKRPCNKPCSRIIKCGHECIGLCGDKCPVICRNCDKTVETKPVTGEKDDGTARICSASRLWSHHRQKCPGQMVDVNNQRKLQCYSGQSVSILQKAYKKLLSLHASG
ncbi:NFX1-type zinc finger-containing protein 1 [Holothuria leucospilota]|uniref:NFX1-type zinc finger-containing protein 1 n=1 Tax=Holothuria leucospilota TaxID=206669 RepID=A0A9Q1HC64_HOLLE|nr:NFX1-type zinc finger-containing protein 1 [Holothuria leucospilota]